jgi:hypothetical protein
MLRATFGDLEHSLYRARSWTFQKVGQRYLENSGMWCWRRMDISWTDCLNNEEVLHSVKEEKISYTQ